MGGPGSGSWSRGHKKDTVEESLVLAMKDVRPGLFPGGSGSIRWCWPSGFHSSIGFRAIGVGNDLQLLLEYLWNSKTISSPIVLATTPTRFGGLRF